MPVQFGALTSASGQNVSSVTFAHTVSSTQYAGGTKLLLVAVTFIDRSVTPINITYNGVGMTRISLSGSSGGGISQASGDYPRIEYWHYLNPPTGSSYNVVVTFASANYIQVAAWSFSGVNATTPLASFASTSGFVYPAGSQTASVSLASSTGSIAVNTIAGWNTFSSSDYGSGQNAIVTPWFASSDGSWRAAGSAKATSSVATTMSWTVSTGGTNVNLYRYLLAGLVVQSNDATFGGNNITSSYSFSQMPKIPAPFAIIPRWKYLQNIQQDLNTKNDVLSFVLTVNSIIYNKLYAVPNFGSIKYPVAVSTSPVKMNTGSLVSSPGFRNFFSRAGNVNAISANPKLLTSPSLFLPRWKYLQLHYDPMTVGKLTLIVLNSNTFTKNIRTSGIVVSYVFWS